MFVVEMTAAVRVESVSKVEQSGHLIKVVDERHTFIILDEVHDADLRTTLPGTLAFACELPIHPAAEFTLRQRADSPRKQALYLQDGLRDDDLSEPGTELCPQASKGGRWPASRCLPDLRHQLSDRQPKVARTFTEQDHAAIRARLTTASDELGRMLIVGTHPTGAYSSTSLPTTKLSADSRDIRVSFTCYWRGAVLNDTYQTVFTFTINKQSGLGGLRVERDSAIIKIKAQNIRDTEETVRRWY